MPRWIESITLALAGLPRAHKRLVMLISDALFIPLALWCGITLRLGTTQHGIENLSWLYAVALIASIPVFAHLGLYRAVIRFLGARALFAVSAGVTASTAFLLFVELWVTQTGAPRAAFVIYWALALIYVAGSRFVVR